MDLIGSLESMAEAGIPAAASSCAALAADVDVGADMRDDARPLLFGGLPTPECAWCEEGVMGERR